MPLKSSNVRIRKSGSGFTLIEVLVALSIMAIILTTLFQAFRSTMTAIEIVDRETEVYRMARISLELMADDIRSSYFREDDPGTGFFGSAEQEAGPSNSLEFTAFVAQPVLQGREAILRSTVAYHLLRDEEEDQDEDPVFYLMRETAGGGFVERVDIAERVVRLAFRFFQGEEWQDTWDTSETKRLPRAVSVSVVFLDDVGRELSFETIVEVPLGLT